MVQRFAWITALLLVILVIAVFTLYRPARILVPQAFGMTCPSDTFCVDDVEMRDEAEELAAEAMEFVEAELGMLRESPTFLFCSTDNCFSTFSDPAVAAQYYWGAGIVLINAHGWEPHIVRHEVIHHWQQENFGGASAALDLPRWFIEGMAYTLSDDPRDAIPNEEANSQRHRFQQWQSEGNHWRTPPS